MSHIKRLLAGAAAAVTAVLLSIGLTTATPAFASNTYPYGQCTYYAKSVRTDIGNHWGNARYWASAARANGFPVDSHPRVGDVVVFGAYVQGNSPYGHVGIVTAVQGTQFKVVSMWGNEANGRIHVNWHHTGAGVSFIHKKGTKAVTAKPATTSKAKPAAKATAKATTPAAKPKATGSTPKIAANKQAVVQNAGGGNVRYREGAGLDYPVKGTVSEGDSVLVLEGPVDGWYRVKVGSTIGWISGTYLGGSPAGTARTPAKTSAKTTPTTKAKTTAPATKPKSTK